MGYPQAGHGNEDYFRAEQLLAEAADQARRRG
jgi:hypothetical protein